MTPTGLASLEVQYVDPLDAGVWKKLWSRKGSQGADWLQAKVMVPVGTQRLRFVAVSTPGEPAVVAVDAVTAFQLEGGAPDVISLCSKMTHSCAAHLLTGQLKCWGSGNFAQLGYGGLTVVGAGPGEMGAHLPAIDLGEGSDALQVACGVYSTCVILRSGSLKCFGLIGDSGSAPISLGVMHPGAIGDESDEMGSNLPSLSLAAGETVKQVEVGVFHTCALLHTGAVKCFGQRAYLGLGDGPGPQCQLVCKYMLCLAFCSCSDILKALVIR